MRPFISSKTVILKVVRDLGLGGLEIPWQDMVEWIGEGLQHIGAMGQLEERCEDLDVEGYRAKLPCDYFSARPNPHVTYRLSGDNIVVGFSQGRLYGFNYLAFAVDEEGFPLVPDNISYATALFWKVAMQLSIRGELPNKELNYATCKLNWGRYCVQAGVQGQVRSPEWAQRWADQLTARIPQLDNYYHGFAGVNDLVQPVERPSDSTLPLGAAIPRPWSPTPGSGA